MNALAKSVSFDPEFMWVDLSDGRRLGVPLAYFPRLLYATPEQRSRYEMSGGGTGLHGMALTKMSVFKDCCWALEIRRKFPMPWEFRLH